MPPSYLPQSSYNQYILPATGTIENVVDALSLGVYASSTEFLSGAAAQVSYVYNELGGEILDQELTEKQVYESYERATTEYSYILNLHQGKNVLMQALGSPTASFDHEGTVVDGPEGANLTYPRFDFGYMRRTAEGYSAELSMGGTQTVYSASFDVEIDKQDYDLQQILYSASLNADCPWSGSFADGATNTLIRVKRVFYKTPRATWRYFGYYGLGGLDTVGALSSYGQFASASTFQLVPVWQNKLQAMHYSDALYTRLAHYSYELRNNKLRIFPIPREPFATSKMWFEFIIPKGSFEDGERENGMHGVNNLGTLPFDNLPYEAINAIGKHWIRRFSLALCKMRMGYTRSKLRSIPIPGNELTLNGAELLTEGKEEVKDLREELKKILDELTYQKLAEMQADTAEKTMSVLNKIPLGIYVG